jgi:glycosyltransferase involved in cell wall biosynthesis
MIIGIDGNEANVYEKVGVSVYTFNLLHLFSKSAKKDLRFVIFLKHKPNSDLPTQNEYFAYKIVPGNFLWSQTFLPFELYKRKALGENIDVFFSPAHYAPRFCPAPVAVTIHDLSYLYYPEEFLKKDLYQLKNWTKYSVDKAKKIIAVSQTTKKDLVKNYHLSDEKIEVIYNGYENKIRNPQSVIKNLTPIKSGENYILYVGTLQPRKNISTLINAFKEFVKNNKKYKLIIAGKKGWLYENIFSQVRDLNLTNKIKFVGYVSDEELVNLYKNAFCFVLPSLYEGFGIPILQAMNYGCPVISSFSSSLPEVGGDACLYFNPKDQNDLVEKLQDLRGSESLRKELIKKGKNRIKKFSWKTCAQETLKILMDTAK